jgi:hypothetical protein
VDGTANKNPFDDARVVFRVVSNIKDSNEVSVYSIEDEVNPHRIRLDRLIEHSALSVWPYYLLNQ